MLIVLVLGFYLLRPAAPPTTLPKPNGYDDFVKAGQMIAGTANAEAIKLGKLGLTRECRVPIQYSLEFMHSHTADLVALRHLALALSAEGKLAEAQNRPSDALKSYLDCVRLGNQSARGGLFVDKMVGLAIEEIGLSDIQKMTNEVSLTEYREAIQTLESLEANSELADDILKRDKIWTQQTYSRMAYWRAMIHRMIQEKTLHPARPPINFKTTIEAKENQRRKLLVDLATRAYELEKGERPKSIADLVPNYLKIIPLDPITGTNIVFKP